MKIVLTGGPCSGKSWLLDELARRGYTTVPEAARAILSQHVKISPEKLQRSIERLQLEQEATLNGTLAFLDRGLIDIVAYRTHHSLPSSKRLLTLCKNRYDLVFMLEQFPFEKDGLRIEKNKHEAKKIHRLIGDTYLSQGYNPIIVPAKELEWRADFIERYIHLMKGGEQ